MRRTQGLADEQGAAFEFDNQLEGLIKPQSFVDQISIQLKTSNKMMIVANVKVLSSSFGTLFSIENNKKGL